MELELNLLREIKQTKVNITCSLSYEEGRQKIEWHECKMGTV
jgi:hypothetical protein